jgi:signal transduction histidine kinase
MESPTPNDLFIAYYNTASDFRQMKQFDKAKEYMASLEPLLTKITPRYQLDYYFEYYQILLGNDDVEKAKTILYRYDSCLNVLNLSEIQKLDYTALSKKLHGLYELNYTKNYGQAKLFLADQLSIAREMENSSLIITSQQEYAMALFELGNYNEAAEVLENTYAAAMKDGLKNQAYKTASLLSRTYENLNELKNGYHYARMAIELQDSIIQEDEAKMVNFLEAKYQHEKKEKEISTLQLVNKEKEFLINRKNWFIAGSLSLALILILLAAYITRYYKSKQKLLRQEKDLQQQKINNLEKQQQVASLQAMINGQETERTRIARDLHDGLGGIFSTVKMHYSTLQHDTPQVSGNPIYRKTMDLINNAAEELRRVAHNMMPEVLLKVGLNEALKDLCNNISSGKLLKITFQSYGMETRLSSSTEIMLYRIIQELVNNIIKHSEATEAIIQINREGNRLSLTIEDNGRGFDTLEAETGKSLGMNTVKSRVDYLNGSLSIDSRKDLGTTIMIDLLLNEN